MTSLQRLALAFAAVTLLSGFYIKLDPGDPEAEVYVYGVSQGRGEVRYETPLAWFPEAITVDVHPPYEAPYAVSIERRFDPGNATIGVAFSLGLGACLFYVLQGKGVAPFATLAFELLALPLSVCGSYKVDDRYDLRELHKAKL